MADLNFDTLTVEELVHIQTNVAKQLEKRVLVEMKQMRTQVEKLAQTMGLRLASDSQPPQEVKPEPESSQKSPVLYRHPDNESLLWNGQGRKPKWVKDLLKEEWNLDDLRVTEEKASEAAPKPQEPKEEQKPEEGTTEEMKPSVMTF
jgi:DNA-binding protein H-NS